MNEFKDRIVLNQQGTEEGKASGATHRCSMESCKGVRVSTKWADGITTYPCSEGMRLLPNGKYQIQ